RALDALGAGAGLERIDGMGDVERGGPAQEPTPHLDAMLLAEVLIRIGAVVHASIMARDGHAPIQDVEHAYRCPAAPVAELGLDASRLRSPGTPATGRARDPAAGATRWAGEQAARPVDGAFDELKGGSVVGATVLDIAEVTFRRGQTQILHGIDLRVRAGEHWVLIGPNGAGKSTLLSFASAQVFPSSGTVDILGSRMGRVELAALRRLIGHVNPRHPLRSNLSVREVVLTGLTGTIERPLRWEPEPAEVAQADALIAEVGLTSRAEA